MDGNGEENEILVKVIVIGDSGVGKTNLVGRYCHKSFKSTHIPTIGVDFKIKKLKIGDRIIKLQVWDTAGQQRFKTITQTYFRGAAGIILVYSVDSLISFQNICTHHLNLEKWVSYTVNHTTPNINKILVGNKIDINPKSREVTFQQGQQKADKMGISFMEVSAKQDIGTEKLFNQLAVEICEKLEDERKQQFNTISKKTIALSYKMIKESAKELDRSYCEC